MQVVMLCDKRGWTYHDYKSNPSWFNSLLWGKIDVDAKHEDREMKKAEKEARRGR